MLSLLTWSGVRPSQAMNFLEALKSGPGKLGFKRKDGYNYLNKERLEMIKGGNVSTSLSLFEGMKLIDKRFTFDYTYTIQEDRSLGRLFWCDGMSKAEYDLFGDVLVFDSTYKTNKYLFPLVIFSGINNHGSTCIFGAAIMYNETIDSYRWLLKCLRDLMEGKIPGLVLIDQDSSMRAAIRYELPGACHCLCSWHLARNARSNLDESDHVSEFIHLIRKRCSTEEFELRWRSFIESCELSNHKWLKDTYQIRRNWAEAYFHGYFMAMTRTTQRAESMNSLIKISVKQSLSLTAFLKHYHRTLRKMRNEFFGI